MTPWAWLTWQRLTVAGITVVALVAAAAAAVWFLVLRSPATPVGLRQALLLYRHDARDDGRDDGRANMPPPGVYRYRTRGGEQLSFGGIDRSFPAGTEMIVTPGTCTTVSWEPLAQHTEGMEVCRSHGALDVRTTTSYEQIAGATTTTVITCPAGTWLVPPEPDRTSRWTSTCHDGRQAVTATGAVVGATTVDVGGQRVPALHTRLTLQFHGTERGDNPNDFWVAPDGLILRQRESVALSQTAGPLGTVRYTERMAVALESLAPLR